MTFERIGVLRKSWKGDTRKYRCLKIPARYFRSRTFYKVLTAEGSAPVAHVNWSLPDTTHHNEGMWQTVSGSLIPCKNGIHIIDDTPMAVRHWLHSYTRRLFVVEVRGGGLRTGVGSDRKYIVRTARIVREIVRGTEEWKTFCRKAGLPLSLIEAEATS